MSAPASGAWLLQALNTDGFSASATPLTVTITVTLANADPTVVLRNDYTVDVTILHQIDVTVSDYHALIDGQPFDFNGSTEINTSGVFNVDDINYSLTSTPGTYVPLLSATLITSTTQDLSYSGTATAADVGEHAF